MDTEPNRSSSVSGASLWSRLSLQPSSQDEGHEPYRDTSRDDEAPGDWIVLVGAVALAAFLFHAWHVATHEPHAALLLDPAQDAPAQEAH